MRKYLMMAALAAIVVAPVLAVSPGQAASSRAAAPGPGTEVNAPPISKAQTRSAWQRYGSGHGDAYQAYGAVTPFGSPTPDRGGGSREAAIRQCTSMAGKFPEKDSSTMPGLQYRACMARHGQME